VNNRNKKKKYRIIAVVAVLYLALVAGILARDKILNIVPQSSMLKTSEQDTTAEDKKKAEEAKAALEAEKKDNYNKVMQSLTYDINTAPIKIDEADCISLIKENNLPALSRMSEEDTKKYMSELQVLKKIEKLGIDPAQFETPELNWKNTYNTVDNTINNRTKYQNDVRFNGSTASELNALIATSDSAYITIESDKIILDETINLKSDIGINASKTEFVPGSMVIDKAVMAEDCDNISLDYFKLENGGYNYALYIIRTNNFSIKGCTFSKSTYKGLVVMGTCTNFVMLDNNVTYNGNGGVFLNGNISNGIIKNNDIEENYGTRNLTAGMVMTSMTIDDYYTAYNEFKDEHLYDLLDTPHDIVLYQNRVQRNNSSGVYSDGAYNIYIIENIIYKNEKEGMCLDYGTFGAYVHNNVVRQNGGRFRQTDEDLEADFVTSFGRLEDGSSPAKLPGISIDNSAYNIILNNNVNQNYGSGIKSVRSAYRNVIMENTVSDNNYGENEKFHFFGIEIGHASTPDEPVIGLDFTASYENIVCRNVVTGPDYAGVFLEIESYCNDVFDNVIMGSEKFAIECHSTLFNSIVNNTLNQEVLNLYGH
jgi:parallel beta-helix repeat protein